MIGIFETVEFAVLEDHFIFMDVCIFIMLVLLVINIFKKD